MSTTPVKLRCMGVPEHFNLPWLLAIDDGAFRDAGLDIEWTDAPGGTGEMSQALFHGDTDLALLLTEGAVNSILTGNDCSIHSIYVDSPLVWGVFAGHEADADLDIGKAPFIVSRYYSGSHLMGFVYADQHGRRVTRDDFTPVGGIAGAVEAFKEDPNRLFLWEKNITMPYVDRKQFKLVDECTAPWPAFAVVVRNEVLAEKREAIDRAMKVVRDYAFDLQYSGEEGAELVAHLYEMQKSQATDWLEHVKFSLNGSIEIDTLREISATMHRLGVLESMPDDEKLAALLA